MKSREAVGTIYVLLAGIGFGFLGVFGRWAFQSGMNVGELLTWRFITASILLWLGLLLFQRKLLRLPLRQVLISFGLGLGGYAVFSTFYFKAIEGVSVPLAALLLFTFPIFVNLGSHFLLKERLSLLQAMSLLLACIGLGILLWGPMIVNSFNSVLFGLGSAIVYSIYVLVSGRVQKDVPPLSSSLYVITSAAMGLFLFHQPDLRRAVDFSSIQIFSISGLAVFSTIGPLTFFLAGLQRMPSSKASIVVMVEPMVAVFAGRFLLGEKLSPFQWIGAVLVFLSLILNALDRSQMQARE